ncbi:hypothetical protein IV203_014785 [Nitzschia inconspicua]|uniref:HAT C-terminal dimerisation domain-containing protein n=1 Tax=Nitzschia inconspicua TaxID=303405 RepID=A0A9K3K785_9STRA|nr:hypothetical protein IV203_020271 [Nitzschia inconspicua]KAG7352165.1 hypothetical protein IV203_008213 [Nitzschia inconspicua]KAG7358198.1 hypothetical protein IV203_014785 [Nitzschia inconspicua]
MGVFGCAAVAKNANKKAVVPDESVKVTGFRHGSSTMEEETRTGEERDADAGLSLAEKALKRLRLVSTTTSKSAFMDLHFIVPTSNMCERLFSEAGYGLNSRRMRTLPSNFETNKQNFLGYKPYRDTGKRRRE